MSPVKLRPVKRSLLLLRAMFALVCVLYTVLLALGSAGYRINTTNSAPLGVWRLKSETLSNIQVGDYILLCPPKHPALKQLQQASVLPAGYCRNGEAPFIKTVVALPGAFFAVTDQGVYIDGTLMPNSAPVDYGSLAVAEPGVVPQGHLIGIQTLHPRSLDSRYFGPIPATSVFGVMEPTWIARTGT